VTAERRPEPEDHRAGLKETNLLVGLASPRPPERFVEPTGTPEILDTERHQADALFHGQSIAPPGLEHALCGVQDLLRRVSFTRAGSRVGAPRIPRLWGNRCR
jgi:hypothetical protein